MTDFFQVPDIGALHEPSVHEPPHEPVLGAGAMLRQAREAAGLHVAALAVSMKVPVRKLEALEAERFGELGDPVYVRALAASMCRALKIQAEPFLRKLPKTLPPRLDVQERGIKRPFQTSSAISGKAAASFVTRPAVLLVLLLLVGAVVLLLLPNFNSKLVEPATAKSKPASVDEIAVQTVKLETSPEASPDTKPIPMPSTAPTAATVDVAQAPKPASSAISSANAPAPVSAPVLASVAAKPAQAASAVAPSPLPPSGPALVRFKASASSWVRVTDRTGKVQLEKTLASGETGEAWGELPLSVVVGNVAVTTVQVRGKAFSMDGIAIDNVARFEVK